MSVYDKMTAIANAIRSKTGGIDPLTLDDMAAGVDEVYNKGKERFGLSVDGSGKVVRLDNLNPNEHTLEVVTFGDDWLPKSGVSVTRCGANLLDLSRFTLEDGTNQGLTFTVEDGYIRVVGKPTHASNTSLWLTNEITYAAAQKLPAGLYSTPQFLGTDIGLIVQCRNASGAYIGNVLGQNKTVNSDFYIAQVGVWVRAGIGEVNLRIPLTLSYGSSSVDYDPFNKTDYISLDDEIGNKGVVFGMTSLSPITTIIANEGYVIAKGYADQQAIINGLTNAIMDFGGDM